MYTPPLWYYELLLFTIEREESRETQSTCGEVVDDDPIGENEVHNESELSRYLLISECSVHIDTESQDPRSPTTPSTLSRTPTPTPRKVPKRQRNAMPEKAYEVLNKENNEFSIFGSSVAYKLQRMTDDQRNIAEHLINTVLHHGVTKKLNANSTVMLQPLNPFNIGAPYNILHSSPTTNYDYQLLFELLDLLPCYGKISVLGDIPHIVHDDFNDYRSITFNQRVI
ncbi:hypothetical protein FQA39_LY10519 [Lamprigera yunnana]|nr:hypothetical protein FQA39_LY10519 [Lamprigera yunnana]